MKKVIFNPAWPLFICLLAIGAGVFLSKITLPTPNFLRPTVNSQGQKPAAEPTKLSYQNKNFGFGFDYLNSLNLYHESDENYLRQFPENGKRTPYLMIFLEEANGPEYKSRTVQEEFMRSYLSIMTGATQKTKMVNYRVTITVGRKWVSETLNLLIKTIKKDSCANTAINDLPAIIIGGRAASGFTCGPEKIYLFLSPKDPHHYLIINGHISTSDQTRKSLYEKSFREILTSFKFL